MRQSIISTPNDRYNVWKRLAIFVIDALMSFGTFCALFFTLGMFSIRSISANSINVMNDYMKDAIVSEHLEYEVESRFGLVKLSYDKTLDKLVEVDHMDVEKANEKFYEYQAAIEKKVNQFSEYTSNYKTFYTTYSLTSILSLTIPLFIFQLLIPILNKRHQTLAMMMFKAALCDNKTETFISNVKVLLRFMIILVVEYLCVYILLNWIGLLFVILASFASISIMKTRPSLHDLILKVKMKDASSIYTE